MLLSSDGNVGKAEEYYFDDRYWVIRYLVADTGSWLTGRQVLISPHAMTAVNVKEQYVVVALTRAQIEGAPSPDSDKPVSMQFQESYYGYFSWPMYWSGDYMWGPYPYLTRDSEQADEPGDHDKKWDPHLRSTARVTGYHVHATDGDIGHVEDFIVDDENWAIRYLVVDTWNLLPGKKVLISPKWIERVSWSDSKVIVHLSRESVKESPPYSEKDLLTRDYEAGLHAHYDRKGYWEDEPSVAGRRG
jgi:hypothetical protein